LQSTELQLPGQLQLFQHFQPGQIWNGSVFGLALC
jgi:hypothetical protein